MRKYSKVVKRCPRCRSLFVLGMNGALANHSRVCLCDHCTGVTRDLDGYAWEAWENSITMVKVGEPMENSYTVTRAEAFGVTR